MKVHIVGASGNMGQRYFACMKLIQSLKPQVSITISDIGAPIPLDKDRYIVATPTENHPEMVQYLLYETNGQVLCEKPYSKKEEDLDELSYLDEKKLARLRMVNQYRYIHKSIMTEGSLTSYNYFNSGKDGLAYDCINLIGLANAEIKLETTSPIWKCTINGSRLNRNDVDEAYIHMLWEWFKNRNEDDVKYIIHAHLKVKEWLSKLY